MAAQRRPDLSSAYSMVSLSMAEISRLGMTLAAWIRAREAEHQHQVVVTRRARSRRAGRSQHGEHQEEIALPEALGQHPGTSMQAMEVATPMVPITESSPASPML